MDYLEFAWKIVEQQGILALILLIQVWQNNKERAAMVHKICTLQNFLMECLRLKMVEDSTLPGSFPSGLGQEQGGYPGPGSTITQSKKKVEP